MYRNIESLIHLMHILGIETDHYDINNLFHSSKLLETRLKRIADLRIGKLQPLFFVSEKVGQ